MPLSEHELRTLEQLEAQLSAEDPKFAQAMQHDPARRRRRQRAVLAALMALAGLGLVMAATLLKQNWLGLVGALVIAAGAVVSIQMPSRHLVPMDASERDLQRTNHPVSAGLPPTHPARESGASSVAHLYRQGRPARAAKGTTPFMARLEERWERRRRESQGW